MTNTIFFLSDYGRIDEFVGVVHAVIRRCAPAAVVIDLTHDIEPFDVVGGSRALVRAISYLGDGVVLAVVDPGVGGSRRGLALEVCAGSFDSGSFDSGSFDSGSFGPRYFVGPDNGLLIESAERIGRIKKAFSLVPCEAEVRKLQAGSVLNVRSSTFDGRDVFAPAAAALSNGAELDTLGEPIELESLVRLRAARVERVQGRGSDGKVREVVRCEVAWVDRFGNVQLTAELDDIISGSRQALFAILDDDTESANRIEIAIEHPQGVDNLDSELAEAEMFRFDTSARWVNAYGDLKENELGLISDANGRLALVLREGSAALRLGVGIGTTIAIAI